MIGKRYLYFKVHILRIDKKRKKREKKRCFYKGGEGRRERGRSSRGEEWKGEAEGGRVEGRERGRIR